MKKSSGFTLVELLIVIVIIGILASIGLSSFASAQAKSRDAKRKANLSQIASALELYYNDKGTYPADSSGGTGNFKICGELGTSECVWGEDGLTNTVNSRTTTYMIKLPTDPIPTKYRYYYNSTSTYYQLYARLENTNDKEISQTIIDKNLDCDYDGSTAVCNYGVSSGNTTP